MSENRVLGISNCPKSLLVFRKGRICFLSIFFAQWTSTWTCCDQLEIQSSLNEKLVSTLEFLSLFWFHDFSNKTSEPAASSKHLFFFKAPSFTEQKKKLLRLEQKTLLSIYTIDQRATMWNIAQWKISYKKRNLLAKIDFSGKQKPICGIEGPLYQSSYTEVVLEMTKGLSRNSCPKWPLSLVNPMQHVFFAGTSGYLTNQKSKYEGL